MDVVWWRGEMKSKAELLAEEYDLNTPLIRMDGQSAIKVAFLAGRKSLEHELKSLIESDAAKKDLEDLNDVFENLSSKIAKQAQEIERLTGLLDEAKKILQDAAKLIEGGGK